VVVPFSACCFVSQVMLILFLLLYIRETRVVLSADVSSSSLSAATHITLCASDKEEEEQGEDFLFLLL
jgi:hypothetical protein